jgi:hypothetical protein
LQSEISNRIALGLLAGGRSPGRFSMLSTSLWGATRGLALHGDARASVERSRGEESAILLCSALKIYE